MIVDTFAQFVAAAADVADRDKESYNTPGQRAYALLYKVRPDLALLIVDSDYNPQSDDGRFPLFYDFLRRHWDEGKPKFDMGGEIF